MIGSVRPASGIRALKPTLRGKLIRFDAIALLVDLTQKVTSICLSLFGGLCQHLARLYRIALNTLAH